MAFGDSPTDKVTKKIIANDRAWKRLMQQGDMRGMSEGMGKIEPLMAELYSACLEDKAMVEFFKDLKLGKSEFMATYKRLEGNGIGTPGIAMAMTDPKVFFYVLQENNNAQLQSTLIANYGTSW